MVKFWLKLCDDLLLFETTYLNFIDPLSEFKYFLPLLYFSWLNWRVLHPSDFVWLDFSSKLQSFFTISEHIYLILEFNNPAIKLCVVNLCLKMGILRWFHLLGMLIEKILDFLFSLSSLSLHLLIKFWNEFLQLRNHLLTVKKFVFVLFTHLLDHGINLLWHNCLTRHNLSRAGP